MTKVLGLTGSIGMGKSATAAMFRELGVPVHDADLAVHALYRGRAVPPIAALFPDAVRDGVVDRTRLGPIVLADPAALRRLEAIVHPMVREEETAFLDAARREGAALAVLDVPLLYETGGETRCDAVAVVSAPAGIQAERVLARPGMDAAKFAAILAKQVSDAEKRRRADFVVDTSRGFDAARAQVRDIIDAMTGDAMTGRGDIT